MIISLLGYMGSGKTHISNVLSKKINFKLIDLDKEIISKNNLSIPEIFEKRGEIFFRKQERLILESVLSEEKNIVLSLGGGTPAYYDNIQLINQYSESFYLSAKISTLSKRLSLQKSKRPLIANISNEDLPEFIGKHLFERNFYYNQAKFTVETDDKSPEEIAEKIIHLLHLY